MWPNACVVRYEGGKMEKCMKLDKVADVTTSEIVYVQCKYQSGPSAFLVSIVAYRFIASRAYLPDNIPSSFSPSTSLTFCLFASLSPTLCHRFLILTRC